MNAIFDPSGDHLAPPSNAGVLVSRVGALRDANTATAVGTAGSIFETTDGGATWVEQNRKTGYELRDVFFINSGTGVIVGDQGTILRTTTGGVE